MGTPEFAVESLRALVEGGYDIVGVVTMPDKPVGRHAGTLQPSPVKQYALAAGLPVLQPERLKDEEFISELRALRADLQIVVAFRMLPEIVWAMPRLGTFNLHASLLPQYRGAAPINWAVINGEKETGVTTFFLTHEIDTGRIILQRRLPIAETDDVETVHDGLMILGSALVVETVDLIVSQEADLPTFPQSSLMSGDIELRPAPKIFKDTCCIDWTQSAAAVYNFIRGLSPYPAAWTTLAATDNGSYFCGSNPASHDGAEPMTLKIFSSEKIIEVHSLAPGSIRTDGKRYFDIAVADGFIRALSLQLAGKKRLPVKDFLNGMKQIVK
jgi:methionyl-tRNA formyltransferase